MNRLQAWYDRCVDLWKASKRASVEQLGDIARQMDEAHGPWKTEGLGTRSEAVKHYHEMGRKKALALGPTAGPETPERRAYEFARDLARHSRRQQIARPVQTSGDTLPGAIDKPHLDHYASRWASHNALLENVPRGQATTINGVETRILAAGKHKNRPVHHVRAPLVHKRMKMMSAGGSEPTFTMDDLKTIHSGVERAIHAGKVPVQSANRYHVMRQAMQIVHDQHHDPDYPAAVPFKPSYAALDTESLKVMHTGVQHLDEQGFGEAKARLSPILDHAVKSHHEHPYFSSGAPRHTGHHRVSLSYPDLHSIGSLPHQKQLAAEASRIKSVESRRTTTGGTSLDVAPSKPADAPKPVQETAPKPEMPSSYDEYRSRLSAGEKFDPSVMLSMEKLRRIKKSLTTALGSADLLKAWKAWRREAA